MVYLSRKEHFNAAHRLYNDKWTKEKNEEVFGKCSNPNFHGHNYDLWVTVKGEPDPDTGFIINAKELGKIIRDEIVSRFDHKNLNLDVDFFSDAQPSTENFIKVIWSLLESKLPKGALHKLKLEETETIYAEYYGD